MGHALMGRALMGPLGPYGPGPYGLGPHGPGPYGRGPSQIFQTERIWRTKCKILPDTFSLAPDTLR